MGRRRPHQDLLPGGDRHQRCCPPAQLKCWRGVQDLSRIRRDPCRELLNLFGRAQERPLVLSDLAGQDCAWDIYAGLVDPGNIGSYLDTFPDPATETNVLAIIQNWLDADTAGDGAPPATARWEEGATSHLVISYDTTDVGDVYFHVDTTPVASTNVLKLSAANGATKSGRIITVVPPTIDQSDYVPAPARPIDGVILTGGPLFLTRIRGIYFEWFTQGSAKFLRNIPSGANVASVISTVQSCVNTERGSYGGPPGVVSWDGDGTGLVIRYPVGTNLVFPNANDPGESGAFFSLSDRYGATITENENEPIPDDILPFGEVVVDVETDALTIQWEDGHQARFPLGTAATAMALTSATGALIPSIDFPIEAIAGTPVLLLRPGSEEYIDVSGYVTIDEETAGEDGVQYLPFALASCGEAGSGTDFATTDVRAVEFSLMEADILKLSAGSDISTGSSSSTSSSSGSTGSSRSAWRGTWTTGDDYRAGDLVSVSSDIYIALNAITSSTTAPASDETNWQSLTENTGTYRGYWSNGEDYLRGEYVRDGSAGFYIATHDALNSIVRPSGSSVWERIDGGGIDDDSITLAKLAHAPSTDYNSLLVFGADGTPAFSNPPRWRGTWVRGADYQIADAVRHHSRIFLASVVKGSSNTNSPADDLDWIEVGRFLDIKHLNRYLFQHLTETALTSDTAADVYGGTLVQAINSQRLRIGHGVAANVDLRFDASPLITDLDGRPASDFPLRFLVWRQNGGNVSINVGHARMNRGDGATTTNFEIDTVREITITQDGSSPRNYTVSMSEVFSWETLVAARTNDPEATGFYVTLYATRYYLHNLLADQGGFDASDVSFTTSGGGVLSSSEDTVKRAIDYLDQQVLPYRDSSDASKILYVTDNGGVEWVYERPADPAVDYGTTAHTTSITREDFEQVFSDGHHRQPIIVWSEGATTFTVDQSFSTWPQDNDRIYIVAPWDNTVVRLERWETSSSSYVTESGVTWTKAGPYAIGPYDYYLYQSSAITPRLTHNWRVLFTAPITLARRSTSGQTSGQYSPDGQTYALPGAPLNLVLFHSTAQTANPSNILIEDSDGNLEWSPTCLLYTSDAADE